VDDGNPRGNRDSATKLHCVFSVAFLRRVFYQVKNGKLQTEFPSSSFHDMRDEGSTRSK
jgi:hypothetical protein